MERPPSDLANFRNSEIHVPQLGEINSKNSGLLSANNCSEVIFPVGVVNSKYGNASAGDPCSRLLIFVLVSDAFSLVHAVYIKATIMANRTNLFIYLLYRYGLCQVPRLIHVAASSNSKIIRNQLHRNRCNYRRQRI